MFAEPIEWPKSPPANPPHGSSSTYRETSPSSQHQRLTPLFNASRTTRTHKWQLWRLASAIDDNLKIPPASKSSSIDWGKPCTSVEPPSRFPAKRTSACGILIHRSLANTSAFTRTGTSCFKKFLRWKKPAIESTESLEQLRVLYAGIPIGVALIDHPVVGIDTPEDYAAFVSRHANW
jgi:hypothetical protein